MSEVRFEAVVVDFGGVLTTSLQDEMIRFAEEIGIELQDLVRVALKAYSGGSDPLVTAFETGQISDEEFTTQFTQRLHEATGVQVEPSELIAKMFGGVSLEEDMFTALAIAKKEGFKTGLLSNSWGVSTYPRERLEEVMDVIVISGEVAMRKPDPEIFELTASKLGVAPEACVFVDDHPGHLTAAAELGMTTVLHQTPSQTISELEALLGLPFHAHPA